jgi:branched-chain amino acid transport system substrate-binding protein
MMLSRRALVRGAAGVALLAGIGMPAIARAGTDVIRVGHLAPRTGRFAPLGDHAVMGVQLAAEEINAAGGVNGRRIALLLVDSADPHVAVEKAERLIARDKVALLIGTAAAADVMIAQAASRAGIIFIDTGSRAGACSVPDAYVETFGRRYGKPPVCQSWSDYSALHAVAQSMAPCRHRAANERVCKIA